MHRVRQPRNPDRLQHQHPLPPDHVVDSGGLNLGLLMGPDLSGLLDTSAIRPSATSCFKSRIFIASPKVYEMRQGVPKIIETLAQTNVPAVEPSVDSRTFLRIFAAVVVRTRSWHLVGLAVHRFLAVWCSPAPVASDCFPWAGIRGAPWNAAAAVAANDPEVVAVGHCLAVVRFGCLRKGEL